MVIAASRGAISNAPRRRFVFVSPELLKVGNNDKWPPPLHHRNAAADVWEYAFKARKPLARPQRHESLNSQDREPQSPPGAAPQVRYLAGGDRKFFGAPRLCATRRCPQVRPVGLAALARRDRGRKSRPARQHVAVAPKVHRNVCREGRRIRIAVECRRGLGQSSPALAVQVASTTVAPEGELMRATPFGSNVMVFITPLVWTWTCWPYIPIPGTHCALAADAVTTATTAVIDLATHDSLRIYSAFTNFLLTSVVAILSSSRRPLGRLPSRFETGLRGPPVRTCSS